MKNLTLGLAFMLSLLSFARTSHAGNTGTPTPGCNVAGVFGSCSGSADHGARFACEQFAVAGRLGVTRGYARSCGGSPVAGGAGTLAFLAVGSILATAAAGTVSSETLVYLLFPGGCSKCLLWILKRLFGETRRFAQNLIPFCRSLKLHVSRPLAISRACPRTTLAPKRKKSQRKEVGQATPFA